MAILLHPVKPKVLLGHHVNVASDAVLWVEMQLYVLLTAVWTMEDVL